MATYADAITLLMAFFVMLLTFSKYDAPAFEEVAAAIKDKVGGCEGDCEPLTKKLKRDIEDMVYDMQADEVVNVETDAKGVIIELASSAFYKPGSATIRDEAWPVLKNLADSLLAPKYRDYLIEIEGHTDDDPIHTRLFPSNWELSARHATRVVRYLIEQGADGRRLKAVGFAETRPKVPNRDASGNPIKANQATNRRVVVRIERMPFADRDRLYDEVSIEDMEEERKAAGAAIGPAEPENQ